MDEIICEGCGYHFPQPAEKGIVPCPHCGRPAYIPGAILCPKCGHLNQDVSYCVECGTALFRECPECGSMMEVDQKACGICGAVYAKARKTKARSIIKPLLALGFIITLLFACVWSAFFAVPFSGQEGPFADSQLVQARKEAQQQFEREQNSLLFDEIEVTMGEIINREARDIPGNANWVDLYITYPVVVENRGDDAHTILLALQLLENGDESIVRYKKLEVPAHSTIEFVVEHQIGGIKYVAYYPNDAKIYKLDSGGNLLLARLESVDEMARSITSRDSREWDYEIKIVDATSCEPYGFPPSCEVYGISCCEP